MTAILNMSLMARWQRQLSAWRRGLGCPERQPLAAVSYLAHAPVIQSLIEIEQLTLVVLYEVPRLHRIPALRLAGYAARRLEQGVKWGGPEQNRFSKNLALPPEPAGVGSRLGLDRPALLDLALRMEGPWRRHQFYRHLPRPEKLLLPPLWAGFRRSTAETLTGDGPELWQLATRLHSSPEELLQTRWRSFSGLRLFPLDWVSHRLTDAVAVFADLKNFARRRVYRADDLPQLLQGFQGAVEFDLLGTRFRERQGRLPGSQLRAPCSRGASETVAI